jgi:hypothetical protein
MYELYKEECTNSGRKPVVADGLDCSVQHLLEQFLLFDGVHTVNILNIDLSLDKKMKSCTEY